MPKSHPTKGKPRAATKKLPSIKYLNECFKYSIKTGNLTWRERPRKHFSTDQYWHMWNTSHAGKIAGATMTNGYLSVGINGQRYLLHRIIFKIITGKEPLATIDHKYGNKSDNRESRLRSASISQQKQNSKLMNNNTSGHRGVSFNSRIKRWQANIQIHGKRFFLKSFPTLEEAVVARTKIAKELFGEFYRER